MKRYFLRIGLFVLAVLICLVGCVRPMKQSLPQINNPEPTQGLPQIENPEALLKDCALLFQQFLTEEVSTNNPIYQHPSRGQLVAREIPESMWSVSIRALHPFKVTRDTYAVCIWILHNPDLGKYYINFGTEPQKNWTAKGYYVHTNPNLSPPRSATHGMARYYLKATGFEGIDEFLDPIVVF
jgi:hypothetical protein